MNQSFILNDDNNFVLVNPGRHVLPMASLDELDGDNLMDNPTEDLDLYKDTPWWMQSE